MDDDEPNFSNIFPLSRRQTELLVPLTKAERELLNQAAGENTAEWARRVLLNTKVGQPNPHAGGCSAAMQKKNRKPSYEDLCDVLLYLDSDNDDGRPVAHEALGLLIQAGAVSWQGKKHFDLTEHGRKIAARLRNDNAAPELRGVLE